MIRNAGLSALFENMREQHLDEGFGNIVSVMMECASIRDDFLYEMEACEGPECPPEDEEEVKNEALDDQLMEKIIEKIPETSIDDTAVATAKMTNQNVPVDEDEYVGAPLEATMDLINTLIPETEEVYY